MLLKRFPLRKTLRNPPTDPEMQMRKKSLRSLRKPLQLKQILKIRTSPGSLPPGKTHFSDAKKAVAAEESPAVAEVETLSPSEQPVMDEMASIFAKVEDLIAHDTPTGVLVPELPEQPDPFAFATEDSIEKADLDTPFDPVMETPEDKRAAKTKKSAKKRRR